MRNITPDLYHYESDLLLLQGKQLFMKCGGMKIRLSKSQMKLFICLTSKVNEKTKIIDMIWGEGEKNKKNEMKFNKLIYRTRLSLFEAGFPADMLLTIPHFGVCIHQSFLSVSPPHFEYIL